VSGSRLATYLQDPFTRYLYESVRRAGPLRSVSLDITSQCNLRCAGCYYFGESMDAVTVGDEARLQAWIASEKSRGTNFVTVVGGEPSLVLPRLGMLYDNFRINVATNGLVRIPREGFENLPIGVAVWGNAITDSHLRANGRRNLFAEARANYRNDERAFWYYTVAPGHARQIAGVVEPCIQNGNRLLFNYYCDYSGLGGDYDHRRSFAEVRDEIDRAIERYPGRVLTTPYLNRVITGRTLYDMTWGYDVCTNLSVQHEKNHRRFATGVPYNRHFNAFQADYATTRRCCTGMARSCDTCFDTWEHFSWIMLHMRKHMGSRQEFDNWIGTMYLFYAINRLLPEGISDTVLARIQRGRIAEEVPAG
jgi:hypothetical protein